MIYKSWLSYYRHLGLVSITASLQKQSFSLWYINIALTFQTKAWSNMVTFPSCTGTCLTFLWISHGFVIAATSQVVIKILRNMSLDSLSSQFFIPESTIAKNLSLTLFIRLCIYYLDISMITYIRLIKSLSYYTCTCTQGHRQKEIHRDKFNLRATATISPHIENLALFSFFSDFP